MSDRSAAAHKLAEACSRIVLASLLFAAIAIGLAERFVLLDRFVANANIIVAGERLAIGLDTLAGDSCWKSYVSGLPDPALGREITLEMLADLSCNGPPEYKTKSGYAEEWGTSIVRFDAALAGEESTVAEIVPAPARRAPVGNATHVMVPMPPTIVKIEIWTPIPGASEIISALETLWDDELIKRARRNSTSADFDLYRWQVLRNRIQEQRVPSADASATVSARGQWRYPVISRLTLADAEKISQLPRRAVREIDAPLREQVSADLPNLSSVVLIGTAANVVASALALLSIALAAYLRYARATDAFGEPATSFSVFLGNPWTELPVFIALAAPAFSLGILGEAIRTAGASFSYFATMTAICIVAVASCLDSLTPASFYAGHARALFRRLWWRHQELSN